MQLLYFAWMRERIGKGEETLEKPAAVRTVEDLIAHLKTLGPGYAQAFETRLLIRAAVNQTHVGLDHAVTDADEVAFFPPVTGG
ncbi:molybdopterin converting factor subunit 1 [Eilatimonas milleporae]|uniref:Molybdopterin synthase sulfur carrier subunit n=1 Tax=Eilatimonas milleporae TaxID=911205 RepID=A0A3M0CR98_9PROT|nr:molybdopterin converting factor subunit 1 [Eilatimonas milleporae]RMB12008.1 molybdopterin synthase subunit MoaD [Eilatimonas milleporae]